MEVAGDAAVVAVLERERALIGDALKIRFYPLVVAGAEGCRVTDADGKQYLDFLASAAVMATGYRHPRVRDAVVKALDTLWSTMECI